MFEGCSHGAIDDGDDKGTAAAASPSPPPRPLLPPPPPRPLLPPPPPRHAARPCRIKVLSMGDTGVGKSCLIKRYCESKFAARYVPTIGADYGVKPLRFGGEGGGGGGREVRVALWDLAGPPAYAPARVELYRGAHAALLVYDAADRRSFDALPGWLREARAHGAPRGMAVHVVAAKTDLPGRRVARAEARAWAEGEGCAYAEASAATGAGVAALFAALFARALAAAAPEADAQLVELAACEAEAAAATRDAEEEGEEEDGGGAGAEASGGGS